MTLARKPCTNCGMLMSTVAGVWLCRSCDTSACSVCDVPLTNRLSGRTTCDKHADQTPPPLPTTL